MTHHTPAHPKRLGFRAFRMLPGLLALSLTTLAPPGHAQSSVSISGTLNAGIFHGYKNGNQLGGISRSNLAISGTEDLGGGLHTTFRLNSRILMDTGELEDSKSFFNAESTVGLKGEFGHVRLGRALTAMWQNDWLFDPWSNYDSIASPAWYLWHGNSPADPNFSTTGVSFSRLNNGVFYESPVIGGFSAHLSLGTEKLKGDRNRSVSAALRYDGGPISLMAATEHTPENKRVGFLAGKYTMGAWAIMAAYDHEKFPDPVRGKNRSWTLSGQYTAGAMTYKVGYGRQQDYHSNFFGVSAVYALSKRTNVYLSAGNQGRGFWGSEKSHSAIGAGINHSF